MAEKNRNLVAHYLNTTPSATAPTYVLLGYGITSLQMAYNPQTTTETYINQDTATTTVDSYQPNIPVNQKVYTGDAAFTFIEAIRQAGPSIGGNDLTDIVEVRLYETPDTAGTSYPASKWNIAIQIDNAPGGDGGTKATMDWTINILGDLVDGDFNVSSPAFTATP
jgi:hypothetical protein